MCLTPGLQVCRVTGGRSHPKNDCVDTSFDVMQVSKLPQQEEDQVSFNNKKPGKSPNQNENSYCWPGPNENVTLTGGIFNRVSLTLLG